MSDAEDDYLSDKFLSETVTASSSKPLTYAQRRLQARREAELKNVQNRKRSRRELEETSRREGLSKSLFEKATEEEQTGTGQGSKAMAMMMKMGFKLGQSLGRTDEPASQVETGSPDANEDIPEPPADAKASGHLVEPLPLDIWSGRRGVGKRKHAVSPTVAGKLAKVVEPADDQARGSFRERARREYEERRAEGRLIAATRTCVTLDEKADKTFNVLWLNPQDPESFPPELLEALTSDIVLAENVNDVQNTAAEHRRLRQQMRADELQPLADLEDDTPSPSPDHRPREQTVHFPADVVENARSFICMNARNRLDGLLAYLRDKHFYCFWCGTQYKDLEDLKGNCPGSEEEDHD